MQLTTKTRYSLRILIQLALSTGIKPVKGKDISEAQNIPTPYLEQILITLKSASLVSTIRGCNGGYVLKVAPEKISVLDIMELFEGKIEFAECLSEKEKCPLYNQCPTTNIWNHLSETLKNEAQKITLKSIIENMPENNFVYEI